MTRPGIKQPSPGTLVNNLPLDERAGIYNTDGDAGDPTQDLSHSKQTLISNISKEVI